MKDNLLKDPVRIPFEIEKKRERSTLTDKDRIGESLLERMQVRGSGTEVEIDDWEMENVGAVS